MGASPLEFLAPPKPRAGEETSVKGPERQAATTPSTGGTVLIDFVASLCHNHRVTTGPAKNLRNSPRNDPRSWAVEILVRIEDQGAFLSHELTAALTESRLDEHQRNLLQKLVKGVVENRSYLDAVLAPYLVKGIDSLPRKVREVLRLGAYQILFLDRIHAGTAVNAAVEMAKAVSGQKLGNVVNAVLRRLLREGAPPPQPEADPIKRIARDLSHPEWLVAHWMTQLGESETAELCRWNNSPWPLFIRVNTLRIGAAACQRVLEAEGLVISPGRFSDDILIVERFPAGRKLDTLESFRQGLFVVHDESSATIARLLAPRAGEIVLDVCAAPGGKTGQIAALMGNAGRILAFDRSALRLKLVDEMCQRLGITIVETRVGSGEVLDAGVEADRVLVDAPCSGLGVVGRRPDIRWHRKPEKLSEFHLLQLAILTGAAKNVRSGGRLVYSTCTTAREENEATVAAFLEGHSHFRLVPLPEWVPASVRTPEGFLRTWPHRHRMGGAFGALMERCE